MPRYNSVVNSFQYGELGPSLLGRTTVDQYINSAKKIENMIVLPSGGARRRPGTAYVDFAQGVAYDRLIPFIFSKDEAYCIWLRGFANGELYVYAFRPKSYTSFYEDNATRTPSLTPPNQAPINHVADLSASTWPWTQAMMDELQYFQTGDVILFTHGDRPPFVIKRTALSTFEIDDLMSGGATPGDPSAYTLNRPYRPENTSAITLTPSATTGNITLTASASFFDANMCPSGSEVFQNTFFKITHGGSQTGVCYVTAFTSDTQVDATVIVDFGANTASDAWQESSWSKYRGFPEVCGSFESRAVLGGNKAEPDTIWGSLTGNIYTFMQNRLAQDTNTDASGIGFFGALVETDPFSLVPSAREVDHTSWIQSGRTLVIGTLGQEFVAVGTESSPLSALSVTLRDQTTIGSAKVQAVRVNKSTIFASRDKKRLYSYQYEYLSQSYLADNLNGLHESVFYQTALDVFSGLGSLSTVTTSLAGIGVKTLHWQDSRLCLWVVTDAHDLVGLTWDPTVKTLAWHRHIMGGHISTSGRPNVLSAAVVPSEDGRADNLWLLVKRQAGVSTTRTFLEIMGPDYKMPGLKTGIFDFDDGELPIFSDCSKESGDGLTGATVFSGFDHLIGKELAVLADGCYAGLKTVDNSGDITLAHTAKCIVAGYPYYPKITFNPIEAGSPIGGAMGMMTRVDRMTIRFDNSYSAKIEGSEYDEDIIFRPGDLGMNDPLPMFTGDKKVDVPTGPERRQEITITQDRPLPMTVLAVAFRGETHE